jgi:hypothetical protein
MSLNLEKMKNTEKHPKLLPSYYYFNEKGLLVFTEDYHLSRGHCCGNKCLNCPYEPKHEKGVTNIKKTNT